MEELRCCTICAKHKQFSAFANKDGKPLKGCEECLRKRRLRHQRKVASSQTDDPSTSSTTGSTNEETEGLARTASQRPTQYAPGMTYSLDTLSSDRPSLGYFTTATSSKKATAGAFRAHQQREQAYNARHLLMTFDEEVEDQDAQEEDGLNTGKESVGGVEAEAAGEGQHNLKGATE